MKLRAFSSLILCVASALPSRAAEHETTAPAAARIAEQAGFDQKLGATLPLDAVWRDESNQPAALGLLLQQTNRPAIVVFGYKECPMLCSQVLTALTETLTDLRLTTGHDFDLIDFSIDPHETPAEAEAQKRLYYKRYLRAGADAGWHFLVSPDETTIRRTAEAAGFRYAYDPVTQQYAHPAGLVVITPEGRVSKYLLGVNFDPHDLRDALVAAGQSKVGSPIEQFLMLCFHFNPVSGRYAARILLALRIAGVVTLLCIGGLLAWLIRRDPAHPPLGRPDRLIRR